MHLIQDVSRNVQITFIGHTFNPIQDRGEGRGGLQNGPPASFSPITSTNVETSP